MQKSKSGVKSKAKTSAGMASATTKVVSQSPRRKMVGNVKVKVVAQKKNEVKKDKSEEKRDEKQGLYHVI